MLLDNKEEFIYMRNIIFNNLFEKLKTYDTLVIERICYSISILMTVGIVTYWPECIEDILNFAKSSPENCLFCIKILENIPKELHELNIPNKIMLRIKDLLQNKKNLIQEFIYLVLTTIDLNNKINASIFDENLQLLKEWVKLSLNLLKIPILSQTIVNYINSENINIISDIFIESINYSSCSKFYSVNEEYDLEKIYQSYNTEEIQSIINLIEMLKNLLINVRKSDDDMLNGISNIFSAITENYINLLFYVFFINLENRFF